MGKKLKLELYQWKAGHTIGIGFQLIKECYQGPFDRECLTTSG